MKCRFVVLRWYTPFMTWVKLVIAVGLSLAAGWIGSLFTVDAIQGWYAALVKPPLTPPNWVFGPVWTSLYLLMGIAAWLVWRDGEMKSGKRLALGLFVIQLAVNSLWSVVFFTLERPGWAIGVIIPLLGLILALLATFYRQNRLAAYLLVPYLLWVTFAGYLNFGIWFLNS